MDAQDTVAEDVDSDLKSPGTNRRRSHRLSSGRAVRRLLHFSKSLLRRYFKRMRALGATAEEYLQGDGARG